MKRTLLVLMTLSVVRLPGQTVVQQFAAVSRGAGVVSDMDLKPTAPGSVLIAMPLLLSPGVKVLSVTDNAPGGGNTYKQVPGTDASCAKQALSIWYCEKCNPDVTELKFHLSDHVTASINAFIEVSGVASTSSLDGSGTHLTDGTATSEGSQVGPSIKTTGEDFIVARYFSTVPLPTGVTPEAWKYTTSYVYMLNGAAGTYQPTLTGAKAASKYCMSVAAFKIAPSVPAAPTATLTQ